MTDEDLEWLKRELQRARAAKDAVQRRNMALASMLNTIDEWLAETVVDELPELPWQEELRAILQRKPPEHIGPPGTFHVAFHWRDREQRGKGLWEALPGDGCGFVEAVEGFGLRMTFDCAGILACADMSFNMLRETLAKEGWGLYRFSELAADGKWHAHAGKDFEPTLQTMARCIYELEQQVKCTEADLERLMDLHYGAGDERNHVRIAADRAATLIDNEEGTDT